MSLRLFVVAAAVAALGLTACGKRGVLERPGPMWGEDERATEEPLPEKKQDRGDARPPAPESLNTSIRTNPIEGAPRDPRAGPGSPQ